MYLKPLIVTGAVLFAASAFAQTSTTTSPGASGASPGHEMQTEGSKKASPGASGYAPGQEMQQKNTGMPNNSTGNMNTKGTGRGTTGTGGAGGSGNK